MKKFSGVVFALDGGDIALVASGPKEALEIDLPAMTEPGQDYLIVDYLEGLTAEAYYVKDRVLRQRSQRPGSFYRWDAETEQWALSIDEARAQRWRVIKAARTEREYGGFEYLGKWFDSDPESQRRIQGAIQMTQLNPDIVIDWTLADNSVMSLDATQLAGLGVALAQHVDALHRKARVLREQIETAETEAELEAIQWPQE